MEWTLAVLLGAIVAPTDAAASVFAVLRVLPIPRKVTGLLKVDPGLNDAPAVVLVLVFSAGAGCSDWPSDHSGPLVYGTSRFPSSGRTRRQPSASALRRSPLLGQRRPAASSPPACPA
ncbi:hypothetical protein GCM10010095_20320 [Streptomyces anthocyanicus]|nr:hypothetical protein GCM10010095_20320 [Streptomyces anthocyanicus]